MRIIYRQTFAQQTKNAIFFDHFVKTIEDFYFPVALAFKFFEFVFLSVFQKIPKTCFVQSIFGIKISWIAYLIAIACIRSIRFSNSSVFYIFGRNATKCFFYGGFESEFVCLTFHN